ncbi:MAG TPA: NADH-quinone oxidoreductase subunit H [Pirellulales bacterium]|jgi:formate hydrogenlyase subunit 4|nr:NADH-quinone oxidoreductase subunit H [Pirellulales bacterium]
MNFAPVVPPLLALLLSPLLVGIINRTKAIFAGRNGPPLAQWYYDLRKLMCKGAVYSVVTTWVFRAGPIVSLAALILAAFVVPFATCAAPFHFQGDLVWFAYLLAVSRFISILAALDTGSAFEGMGASRDAVFSALSEPAMLLGLAAVARQANGAAQSSGDLQLSLTGIHQTIVAAQWGGSWLVFVLVAVSLFVVFLAENARIPIDDPDTHLELTMIHEVMSLDHGGPDFGLIVYASALRLWVFGAVIVDVVLPISTGFILLDVLWSVAALFVLAILVGVIESVMARLRMLRVPQLLVGATALSGVALVLEYGGRLWLSPSN